MKQAGEQIRARRQELGWTQRKLAQKAGISTGFLSDLENGKRSVGAENLLEIASALGVSMDLLMTGKASKDGMVKIALPDSLVRFADEEGLTFRHTCLLLAMRRLLLVYRGATGTTAKQVLETVDWKKFADVISQFLDLS